MTSIKCVLLCVCFVSVSADLISDLCKDCEKCQNLNPRWRGVACRDYFNSWIVNTRLKWENLINLSVLSEDNREVLENLKSLGFSYDGRKHEVYTHCGEIHSYQKFIKALGWDEEDLKVFLGGKKKKKLFMQNNDL
ncbi:ORF7 protein [Wenzhou Suncus murinus alphacoronavirus 1]|nr:ORF7 protein [Wenzhou Suncus murinus alphacoronavirus 1]